MTRGSLEHSAESVAELHFVVFTFVSLIAFLVILRLALRRRTDPIGISKPLAVAFVVVVVGMFFAKWGANSGLSWVIYYGLPAAITILMPPIAFRMRGREVPEYLLMAFVNAPLIHVIFSLFFGWSEYMPLHSNSFPVESSRRRLIGF